MPRGTGVGPLSLDPAMHLSRPFTAFGDFVDGTDPASGSKRFNVMTGFAPNSSPMVNPTMGLVTKFRHTGDPIALTGWLDPTPGDKRLLVASGPTTLQPGEQQDVVVAIVAAQGADRLASLALLRTYDAQAQLEYDSGTLIHLGVGDRTPRGLALENPWPKARARAVVRGVLATG